MPEVKVPYIFGGVLLLRCATGADPPGQTPNIRQPPDETPDSTLNPLLISVSTNAARLQLVVFPFSTPYRRQSPRGAV